MKTLLHSPMLQLAVAAAFAAAAAGCAGQNTITIDARQPAPAPVPVQAKLGSSRAPNGDVLSVNSQYLTRNGKPWIPVMGEFHFSRYPEAEWEQEILKMKAAGVNVVSTYVIWIHHEQTEGSFDWSGQRDLRRFVQICARNGMYVFPRIGPWAHAEVRNGGLPDWVLHNGPVRQNDPVYLKEVGTFYAQIAEQLHGLLWKDGGPVIGIQIENEYRETGVGKGSEHIRTLKEMAVADGLDVPLYTVTGWDGAAIPLGAALPMFGGYPDAPWDGSPKKLPPNEVYAFRFGNRSAGSMGAIGGRGQSGAATYAGTPFFTAEVGDGIEDTYFRRPVVSADDVAAIAPIMLGSGVNLLGYYMFHSGRNPEGGAITLQESQRTGYPTDVPVKSYDFQAPLGEFGQERESLRKLKLVHYFLHDFGSQLAPMTVHAPAQVPSNPADLSVPRVSARTEGNAGFLFVSNYVRGAVMPVRPQFQVALLLPGGALQVPSAPITLPADAYGIWPVNLPIGSETLRYATAQLFKRVIHRGQTYYFFFALPGVEPEMLLSPGAAVASASAGAVQSRTAAGLRLRFPGSQTSAVQLTDGANLVVMTKSSAEQIWASDDPSILLSTPADAFSSEGNWTLQSTGQSDIPFGVFGAAAAPLADGLEVSGAGQDPLLQRFLVRLPAVPLRAQLAPLQEPSPRGAFAFGPALSWRPNPIPLAPEDKDFSAAQSWRLSLGKIPADAHIDDAFLRVTYQGDVARLSDNGRLLDDNFWNGLPWEIGLRELGGNWRAGDSGLQLQVLGLPEQAPMYLERRDRLHFTDGTALSLQTVQLVPQYEVVLRIPTAK